MRGDRETDTETLMARYGVGRRLATRVVALLSRRVDVTGTVLAEAAGDEPLARLLLDPRLPADAAALTEPLLRERAREHGYAEADLLRLVSDEAGGWRTIALEDDLLAEDVRVQEGGTVPDGLGLMRRAPDEITARETHGLFTPEEVARLKLDVLTSQDADQRIEALRKLVFAPMPGPQKATMFMNVLTDREATPKVRREAVRSLEQIGFRSDMADAVRSLFTDSREDALYAVQRLGSLLREAERGEAALILAVLLEVLDQNQDTQIVCELLRLIARTAELLVSDYQKTESFIQSALRQLARDFDNLRAEVDEAFDACARRAPDLMADLLWQEVHRAESARVRSLLLGAIEGLPRTPALVGELARRTVDELLNPALPESEKARLRYCLVRLGEPAVLVALERVPGAAGVQRAECIRLLDVVCTESDVSERTLERAVRVMTDLLKLADTVTRRTVVQAAILTDRRVPPALQRELSGELVALMDELHLPDTLDVIQNALENIGLEALGPAFAFMRREYPSEAAQRASLALASIVENHAHQVPDEVARGIYELSLELLADERLEQGAFTRALAAVCGCTAWGRRVFDSCLAELLSRLWRLPYSMDVLDALAVLAGTPNASPEQQAELAHLFDNIVQYQARTSGLGARRETEHGVVYEFGREIQFDIRAVPAALRGLERICASAQARDETRAEVAKRLLILWEGVSKVRVIWGPAAIEALIRAMCGAACDPRASAAMRVRLGASLRQFLNKIRVVESLGRVCSQPDPHPEMRALAVQTLGDMLDAWERTVAQDEDLRLALLQAAARIAATHTLDGSDELVAKLRERAVQSLFAALRSGVEGVRGALVLIRDCPDTPAGVRGEIDERLTKAFGLVPVDR